MEGDLSALLYLLVAIILLLKFLPTCTGGPCL